jgi:hypothetical protein
MRTLGGAFGSQLVASLIVAPGHGVPSESRFVLAFVACAVALALGLIAAGTIPGGRPAYGPRPRPREHIPRPSPQPFERARADRVVAQ